MVAEAAYVVVLLGVLGRSDRSLVPNFGFAWKVILASLLAAVSVLVTGLPALVSGVLGAAVFAVVITLSRALPNEVIDAFRVRAGR